MKLHILIADDNPADASGLEAELIQAGAQATVVADGEKALEMILDGLVDAIVLESVLPSLGGKELVQRIFAEYPSFPVLVRTRYSSLEDAFEYARMGVLSYSVKDDDVTGFARKVMEAASGIAYEDQTDKITEQTNHSFSDFITRNAEMESLFRTAIERVAKATSTVLITGESGTGKELLARAIHHYSPRSQNPLVAVNCAALPENLIESELFGHEKGSFTGAGARRIGRFELANHGAFFLDEVGDLSLVVQTKLLRVLQERTIERVGGNESIKVDVRVIAATHRNLKQLVNDGVFREDLFYRLSVIHLHLPPLRERPEDIAGLAQYFVQRYRQEMGREEMMITPRAMNALRQYSWQGNIRELENVIERAVVLAPHNRIDLEDLPSEFHRFKPQSEDSLSLRDAKAHFEHDFILQALQQNQGNVSVTADQLRIARKNLQEKIKRYEIDVESLRGAKS